MITINVEIVLPSEETLNMNLPLNTDIDQVYARLVTWGALPTITGRGEPIAYGFYHRRSESYLPAHVSLTDAGIQNGDLIDVVAWPTVAPPERAQRLQSNGQKPAPRFRLRWVVYALVVLAFGLIVLVGWSQLGGQMGDPTPMPKVTMTLANSQTVTFMTMTRAPTTTRTHARPTLTEASTAATTPTEQP